MDLSLLACVFKVIVQRQKLMGKDAPSPWYHSDHNETVKERKHPLTFPPTAMGRDGQHTGLHRLLSKALPLQASLRAASPLPRPCMAMPKLTVSQKAAHTTWLGGKEPWVPELVPAADLSGHQIPDLRHSGVSPKCLHHGQHRGMACEGRFHQVLTSSRTDSIITPNQC